MRYLVCVLFFVLVSSSSMAQTSFANLALTDATLIDANHPRPLDHQTILIKDGFIKDIFPDRSKGLPDSAIVIPLNGKYVIPGLIDSHVHMATDPSETDNRESTLRVLSNMLYSGITSVRDMAGDARTLASLSRDATTGDIASPDIYYSALMAGPTFFDDPRTISSSTGFAAGQAPFMRAVTDTTNLVLAVAEAKGTGATGIKLYANLSGQLAARIIAEAKRQGMKVWGHAWLQEAKPSDLVTAGIGSISHAMMLIYDNFADLHISMDKTTHIPLPWNGRHTEKFWDDSVHIHTSLYRLMKQNNTILDATLAAFKVTENASDRGYMMFQIAKRLTAEAYKAGVKICAGTDDDQQKFVQYEMELLVHDAGFSNLDALIAATRNGAEAIGIERSYGTIEPGKYADLLVLNNDPLEKIENIESVDLVIKRGRVFKK